MNKLNIIFFTSILFLTNLVENAFCLDSILIITDEPSAKSASALKETFYKTKPFSLITNLKIDIKVIGTDKIKCKSSKFDNSYIEQWEAYLKSVGRVFPEKCKANNSLSDIDRLIVCNNEELFQFAMDTGSDHVIFVKESEKYGGSGGNIVIVNSGSPSNVGLHEFVHKFGFGDEYEFGECEAPFYCIESRPNLAFFNDEPPYSSDGYARQKHSHQIQWYSQIKPATLITNGSQLGTPQNGVVGLFPGVTCNKAIPPLKTWKPGFEKTLMGSIQTSFIPKVYWPTILSGLGLDEGKINQIMGMNPNIKTYGLPALKGQK